MGNIEVGGEKYMHILECSTSSRLCDSGIKVDGDIDVSQNLKTASNPPKWTDSGREGEQGLRVPVLNMRGKPIAPTYPRKARKLVEAGRAVVLNRVPFVIQLRYPTGEARCKPSILDIDTGYAIIGFSLVAGNQELVSGRVKLRADIAKLLKEKRMYRRNRRNRLWYRKCRFNRFNRAKDAGWLAPSIRHKLDTYIRLVQKLAKWYPIDRLLVEVDKFDAQKMTKPEIQGIEYQRGELFEWEVMEYLLEKYGRQCIYCHRKNVPFEKDHVVPVSRGGTNRISNLVLACHQCNQAKGNMTAKEFGHGRVQSSTKKGLKSVPLMNSVYRRIPDMFRELGFEVATIHGYETKYRRVKLNLPKSHVNDAFAMSAKGGEVRVRPFFATQTRRNNRCLQINRKGFAPSIRRVRYKLQPNDLVRYKGLVLCSRGIGSKGIRLYIDGYKEDYVRARDVELVRYGKGLQFWLEVNVVH